MKRTQLYLDDDLYLFLETAARRGGQTVSGFVRETLRRQIPQNGFGRKSAAEALLKMAKSAGRGPKELAKKYEKYLDGR